MTMETLLLVLGLSVLWSGSGIAGVYLWNYVNPRSAPPAFLAFLFGPLIAVFALAGVIGMLCARIDDHAGYLGRERDDKRHRAKLRASEREYEIQEEIRKLEDDLRRRR